MLAYTEVKLDSVIVHRIGNKSANEGIILSDSLIDLSSTDLVADMNQYFFSSFKEPLFYSFKPVADELSRNPVCQLVTEFFANLGQIERTSKELADYLYKQSTHPNIKAGDLFVFYFNDLLVDDELVSGIGICKAETKDSFLQVDMDQQASRVRSQSGISIKRVDKACLIFDTDQTDGYKMCVIDRKNAQEANFWMEDFLHVEARPGDYFNTKNYIQMTKSFVQDRMQPLYETDKMEEAEVMNRSQAFFTATETFNEDEYANQVFQRKDLATDFMDYRRDYEDEKGIQMNDDFDVSPEAVKKQSRIFKSVLKLDKNFHIYIHGDREKIEKGQEADGRKFYKVYYDHES